MIPVKDTNQKDIFNNDLKDFILSLFDRGKTIRELQDIAVPDKDFSKKINDKIRDMKYDRFYKDEPLTSMAENLERFKYTIETYKIGETFSILNKPEYSLIRNGFITIGGECSASKTSFLTALSLDILNHNKDICFLFYSLDDSIEISGRRILSQITEKNLFDQTQKGYDLKQVNDKRLDQIIIKTRFDIEYLKTEAENVKKMTGCKDIIIGIDYLQIIEGNGNESYDKRDFYNKLLKQLKENQKDLERSGGCIMFNLSQLNRDTKSDTYRYRDTSEIENQSDVCIDIELPRTGKDKKPDRETSNRILKVTKNKLGKRGMTLQTEQTPAFMFKELVFENLDKRIENEIGTTEQTDTGEGLR